MIKGFQRLKENFEKLNSELCNKMYCERGQGTTEYAILVGVLVVIAIIAIVAFKPALQSLWDSIKDGMENLA